LLGAEDKNQKTITKCAMARQKCQYESMSDDQEGLAGLHCQTKALPDLLTHVLCNSQSWCSNPRQQNDIQLTWSVWASAAKVFSSEGLGPCRYGSFGRGIRFRSSKMQTSCRQILSKQLECKATRMGHRHLRRRCQLSATGRIVNVEFMALLRCPPLTAAIGV